MRHAAETLAALGVACEKHIVSAHRTPDRLFAFAKGAKAAGFKVIIAGAGGAAHLPGMTASLTELPVFGVPIESKALSGVDSLYSIVQMPAGIPVGTLAIGKPGAINAALLAASVLALNDPALSDRLAAWRKAADRRGRRAPGGIGVTASHQVKLKPGDTIGILGGGQLGRMLAMAAARLGLRCQVFSPDPDSPAFDVVLNATCAEYADVEALELFANDVDVITYEFENVPAAAAMILAARRPVLPDQQDPGNHAGPPCRKGFRHAARHRHRRLCRRVVGGSAARRDRAASACPPCSRPAASAMTARARRSSARATIPIGSGTSSAPNPRSSRPSFRSSAKSR